MPTKKRQRPGSKLLKVNNGYANRVTPYLIELHLKELDRKDARETGGSPFASAYAPGDTVLWHAADADYDATVIEVRRRGLTVEYFIRVGQGSCAWARERDLEEKR